MRVIIDLDQLLLKVQLKGQRDQEVIIDLQHHLDLLVHLQEVVQVAQGQVVQVALLDHTDLHLQVEDLVVVQDQAVQGLVVQVAHRDHSEVVAHQVTEAVLLEVLLDHLVLVHLLQGLVLQDHQVLLLEEVAGN